MELAPPSAATLTQLLDHITVGAVLAVLLTVVVFRVWGALEPSAGHEPGEEL